MNFFKAFPTENRLPGLQRLHGGRWALSRLITLGDGSEVTAGKLPANGTVHPTSDMSATELAEIAAAGVTATNFFLVDVSTGGDGEEVAALYKWETLTNAFVDEEAPVIDYDLNGLKRITKKIVAKVGTSKAAYEQGASTLDGCTLAQLKDGSTDYAAKLTLVYMEPGQLSLADDYSNNDKLQVRTIASFNQVPSTPSGFVLIATQASEVEGIPTRTYRFAKGVGEISRETDLANNGALERVTIRHLTAPGGGDPVATLSGYVRVSVGKTEADGHLVWTATFAKGTGVVSLDIETKFAGVLTITTKTELTAPGATAPMITGGFSSDKREQDGHVVYVLRGAVGSGVVEEYSNTRFSGKLTQRTRVYLVSGPAGAVPDAAHVLNETSFRADDRDGYVLYTSIGTSVTTGQAGTVVDHQESIILSSGATTHVIRHVYTTFDARPATYLGGIVEQRTSSEEGYTVYTTTTIQIVEDDLPDEVQSRYGGDVVIRTKRKIDAAPTTTGLTVLRTDVQQAAGYAVYSAVCLDPITAGTVVGTAVEPLLDGYVVRRVYTSLNDEPASYVGTKVDNSTQEEDGYTVYRTTTIQIVGDGTLLDEVQNRYGTSVVIVTKRKINSAPASPGTGYVLLRSDVQENTGFTLFSSVYLSPIVAGTQIGLATDSLLDGKVKRRVYSSLNAEPTTFTGTKVDQSTQVEDGYTVYRTTTIEIVGDGYLPDETQDRYNGKIQIVTRSRINQLPEAPPSEYALPTLLKTDVQPQTGFTIYSRVYAVQTEGAASQVGYVEDTLLDGVVIRRVYTTIDAAPPEGDYVGEIVDTSSTEEDGYTVYRTTTIQIVEPDLPEELQNRYGGILVIATAKKINAPTGITSNVLRDEVSPQGGFTIYATTYLKTIPANGTEVAHAEDAVLDGYVNRHVYTTINAKKASPGAAFTEVDVSTQIEDGYTVYRTTFVEIINSNLPDEIQNRYDGLVVIATKRKINGVPDTGAFPVLRTDVQQANGYAVYSAVCLTTVTAGEIASSEEPILGGAILRRTRTTVKTVSAPVGGEVTLDTSVQVEDGYEIYRATFIDLVSEYLDDEVTHKLGGTLVLTTRRRINASPEAPAPTGYALITSRADEATGYVLFTSTFASGTGNIDSETSLRMGGALRYTTYRSLNAAPTGTAGTLVRSETSDGDGYTLFTYTYCEIITVSLADETQVRLGGALTITTRRSLGVAPSAPAGGVLISARVDEGEGYVLFTRSYASGSGNIDSEFSLRMGGALRYTTYRSLNTPPTGTAGTLVRSETSDGEGHTLYTQTYCEIVGTGDLADETSSKLGGTLTLTTKRKLGTAPASPGVGYAQVSARVDEGEGYVLHTVVFASGTGDINAPETRTRYNGVLTITTKRSLNVAPTAPSGTYVSLISTEISQGDGYAVYTYTWVSGSGLIDETTDTRSDGSQVHVITTLNVATGGTIPSGSYLANQDAEPGDGFIIYTRQYYKPPTDYTVPGVRVVTKPGVMTVTTSGAVPSRQPEVVPVTTSIAVTFTATPTVGTFTPIKGGGLVYERATFTSGEKLRATQAFGSDYYSSGAVLTGSGGTYRGESVSTYASSVVGAADQAGSVVTFGYDAVPFFRSAGVTIFKQTVETGTLPA